MTTKQLDALAALQQRWAHHQDLRATGASIAQLAASRAGLDAARLEARLAERATSPAA